MFDKACQFSLYCHIDFIVYLALGFTSVLSCSLLHLGIKVFLILQKCLKLTHVCQSTTGQQHDTMVVHQTCDFNICLLLLLYTP